MRYQGVVAALVGVGLAAAAPLTSDAAPATAALPQLEHVVVIIEQNHTFDAYFAGYPGARGHLSEGVVPTLPDGRGGTATPSVYVAAEPVDGSEDSESVELLSNGPSAARDALRSGAMDGFVSTQAERGRASDAVLRYHTEETAPLLWDLAAKSVLFDNYYSSNLGGSLPNMLSLITGDDQGLELESKAALAELADSDFETLFDVLDQRQIPWKFYVGRLAETSAEDVVKGRYTEPDVATPPATYWAPILAMPRFWTDPDLNEGLADQADFYDDAATGALPAVSFVLPLPTDHPVTTPDVSHTRLRSVVNALVKSPTWDSTAVFVVWDDWGGFYDHVAPPDGLGFRVPALLVSPYGRPGHVSHAQHDHRSVLGFIARQFALPGFESAQAAAAGFEDAFDFESPPRPGPLLAADLLPAPQVGTDEVNRATLWVYVGALGIAAAAVAATWVSTRVGRRRPVEEA